MTDRDDRLTDAQAARRDFSCLVHTVFGNPPPSQSQALRDAECALEAAILAYGRSEYERGVRDGNPSNGPAIYDGRQGRGA